MSGRALALLSTIGAIGFAAGIYFDLAALALAGVLCLIPLIFTLAGILTIVGLTAFLALLWAIFCGIPMALDKAAALVGQGLDAAAGWIGSAFGWLGGKVASAWKPTVATVTAVVAALGLALPPGVIKDALPSSAAPSSKAGAAAGATVTAAVPERAVPAATDGTRTNEPPAREEPGSTEGLGFVPPVPVSKGLIRAFGDR